MSFDTFSHLKPVYARDFSWVGETATMMRYPPYTPRTTPVMQALTKSRSVPQVGATAAYLGSFVLGAAATAAGLIMKK